MGRRCSYCSSRTQLHSFPKHAEMREKWLDNIPNVNRLELPKYPHLCKKHFSKTSFSVCGRVLYTAVPTIFNIEDYDPSSKLKCDIMIPFEHNYANIPKNTSPSPPPFEEIKMESIEIDTPFEIETPIEIDSSSTKSNLLPEEVLRFSSDVDPSMDYSPEMSKHAIKICKTEIHQLKRCNKLMAQKIHRLKKKILEFENLINNTQEFDDIKKQSCDKLNAELLFCMFD